MYRPKIVCLCGSTKFRDEYIEQNKIETLAGNIVLSVGFFGHWGDGPLLTDEVKVKLDALHLAKIDLADEVFILNVDIGKFQGCYIGESTKSELAYAISQGKPLRFLDPEAGEAYMVEHTHELGRMVADFAVARLASLRAAGGKPSEMGPGLPCDLCGEQMRHNFACPQCDAPVPYALTDKAPA